MGGAPGRAVSQLLAVLVALTEAQTGASKIRTAVLSESGTCARASEKFSIFSSIKLTTPKL
jgi:hypothetical protein